VQSSSSFINIGKRQLYFIIFILVYFSDVCSDVWVEARLNIFQFRRRGVLQLFVKIANLIFPHFIVKGTD
jgi:hypothetical protein